MEIDRSKLRFFRSTAEFRKWLTSNHTKADELWLGFYKKGSGRESLSYPEAVDEALCFGWIDGIRKSLDDVSYVNRFTPRRARSVWSSVNIGRVEKLIEEGRMTSAGLAEYEKRTPERSGVYSFEREKASLPAEHERFFRSKKKAWEFFQSQSPYYRRMASWWVISAKKTETRDRRLKQLIADSAAGRRLAGMSARKQGE